MTIRQFSQGSSAASKSVTAGLAGFFYRKVARHQLARPYRLADLALLRDELCHHRLNVEYRGSVEGVKAGNSHLEAVDTEQTANGCTDPVGTRFSPLGENSNLGPTGIFAGVPLTGDDALFGEIMKMEE